MAACVSVGHLAAAARRAASTASAPAPASLPVLRLVRLPARPAHWCMLTQLRVDEALFRSDSGNWCVLCDGPPAPAVVVGLGGHAPSLVHAAHVRQRQPPVPVVRRFSGGGTVVVDADTCFVSIICNQGDVPGKPLYPREVMRWSAELYAPAIDGLLAPAAQRFRLDEQDYCLGSRKIGGNAQSISRNRWIHHTSFLWDYDPSNMAMLQQPHKTPAYRAGREHGEFITRLGAHVRDGTPRTAFYDAVVASLAQQFRIVEATAEEAEEVAARPQERESNSLIAM